MVCTYEEYLKQSKAITFEKMQTIHTEMLAEIGADVEALELYNELMKVAARYATIRANWLLLSREEKNEQDSGRTSCHNSVIIHFNMLARYLKKNGKAAVRGRKGEGSHPATRHHPFHLWDERYGPREDWPTFPGGAAEDLSEIETKKWR